MTSYNGWFVVLPYVNETTCSDGSPMPSTNLFTNYQNITWDYGTPSDFPQTMNDFQSSYLEP